MTFDERIFSDKPETFTELFDAEWVTDRTLGERTVDRAVVLPLRNNSAYPKQRNAYLGGVCDENFTFIAGGAVNRGRFSCSDSYAVPREDVEYRDETVVFGGIFHLHFGVMLLLSLTRFWYFTEHPDMPHRVVFIAERSETGSADKYCSDLAELIGIPEERCTVITKPTQFARVIIPDEALAETDGGLNRRFLQPFKYIADRVIAEDGRADKKRLYLSRTRFAKAGCLSDGVNEEYYERFFEKRGYTVIHPQELPLREQIRLIASADEIVSTYGTLAHLVSLFAADGTRQIMLLRTPSADPWFIFEAAILKMTKLDWYLVEATKNPYPTLHDDGAFIYYPTAQFKRFLQTMKLPYDESELAATITDEQMKRYVMRWLTVYSSPFRFKLLNDPSLFPLLQALFYSVTKKRLPAEYYIETDGEDET